MLHGALTDSWDVALEIHWEFHGSSSANMSTEWENKNQEAATAEWSVPQTGIFKPGYKFDVDMTYKELREFVKSEHRKLGGDGLTVKQRRFG